MKATELYRGQIVVWSGNGHQRVKVTRVGIPRNSYSQRRDASEVQLLDTEGNPRVITEDSYVGKQDPSRIGQPLLRIARNRDLESLADVEAREAEARKQAEERKRRQDAQESLRTQMMEFLQEHGIDSDDVTVRTMYDVDEDRAEVISVTITGESLQSWDFQKKA